MRVIFMGTPEFSVPALRAVAAEHEVVAVYSQPPRAAGRGQRPRPSAVARAAEALGLAVRTPERLRDPQAQAEFAALRADVAVVVAYGLILPQPVLDAPRLGCLNIHASLLPRWRGAAPIHRAILAGDAETGVAIMRMEAGLDTGPVLAQAATPIGPAETTGALHDRLSAMGAGLIAQVLARLPLPAVPQPEAGVTYAAKIDKAEARIDWSRPAIEVDRLIRALSPFPGAWCLAGEERLKLLASEVAEGSGFAGDPGTVLSEGGVLGGVPSGATLPDSVPPGAGSGGQGGAGSFGLVVACGTGAVRITLAQRAGKRPMSPDELLRGRTLPPRLE